MNEIQKTYKQKYYSENKIIAFPLKNDLYDELQDKSDHYKISVNSYVKKIVTNTLEEKVQIQLTAQQQEYISKYIHISRWIANNINQLAHKANIWEKINIMVLIKLLKNYESEFKNFIANIKNDTKINES